MVAGCLFFQVRNFWIVSLSTLVKTNFLLPIFGRWIYKYFADSWGFLLFASFFSNSHQCSQFLSQRVLPRMQVRLLPSTVKYKQNQNVP